MSQKNNQQKKIYRVPDGEMTILASSGDIDSIRSILNIYKGYISSLAIVKYRKSSGEELIFYDEELRDGLIQKLIEATLKFDINR